MLGKSKKKDFPGQFFLLLLQLTALQ